MALQIGEQIHRESSPPILSVPDGKPAKEVWTDTLLSVEHLEVIGPRDRRDGACTIYGHFRVSDEEKCAAPLTLFNRERHEAATIDLGDLRSRFLPLADDDHARSVIGGSIFYVQLKLWEKIGDEEGEVKDPDPVIVDVDIKYDDFYKTNQRTFTKFKGDSGFKFRMAYAHILGGVGARVQFTIMGDIAPCRSEGKVTRKRKDPIPPTLIYGCIGATQGINEDEVPVIEMFHAPSSDPLPVNIGSPIPLQRKMLVALTGGGCLGISYSLVNAANDHKLVDSVPFCFERDDHFLLRVPENLTYKQESRDGLVSVSLTFVPYNYPPRSPDKSTQVSDVCESES